jgi:hypothetical protein
LMASGWSTVPVLRRGSTLVVCAIAIAKDCDDQRQMSCMIGVKEKALSRWMTDYSKRLAVAI